MKIRTIIIFILCIPIWITSHIKPALSKENKIFLEPKIKFAPKQYVCYKTDVQLKIDGTISESNWQKAKWTDDFIDIEGTRKPKPRFRTRAKMLWDDQFFYIAAELEEPDVWATLKKHDAIIFYDNDFEVFIDPDGDTHRYYELEINAFGTEWDLFLDKPYRDDCKPLFFWDIRGLKTGVLVDGTINQPGDRDQGWTVEIAIPWEVLKECASKNAPPKDGDQWRVNFSRVEWRVEVKQGKYVKVTDPKTGKSLPEDNWVWSPQGLINMHYPEMWGFVQFSEQVAGSSEDIFNPKPEENAKWVLRQVYYSQKNYYKNHGRYTDNIAELDLGQFKAEGYNQTPKIKCTWNLFEACLESNDRSEKWYICQNGRVWKWELDR